MSLFGNIIQPRDIEDHKLSKEEFEELSLLTKAMWEILKSKFDVSDEELADQMEKLRAPVVEEVAAVEPEPTPEPEPETVAEPVEAAPEPVVPVFRAKNPGAVEEPENQVLPEPEIETEDSANVFAALEEQIDLPSATFTDPIEGDSQLVSESSCEETHEPESFESALYDVDAVEVEIESVQSEVEVVDVEIVDDEDIDFFSEVADEAAPDEQEEDEEEEVVKVKLRGDLLKCPVCVKVFSVRDSRIWDGQRHIPCGTRFEVEGLDLLLFEKAR